MRAVKGAVKEWLGAGRGAPEKKAANRNMAAGGGRGHGWSMVTVSGQHRIRMGQLERQAEGYLELGMPRHALDTLARLGMHGRPSSHLLYLRGEALRELERFEEALVPLDQAADIAPSNIHIRLAMGWCHKRLGRLDLAIEDLEQGIAVEPAEAILHFNLACYCSLAGRRRSAIAHLSQAIELDARYRDAIDGERDFDPIRSDPEFQALTSMIA